MPSSASGTAAPTPQPAACILGSAHELFGFPGAGDLGPGQDAASLKGRHRVELMFRGGNVNEAWPRLPVAMMLDLVWEVADS
jgi:hypothetical protein